MGMTTTARCDYQHPQAGYLYPLMRRATGAGVRWRDALSTRRTARSLWQKPHSVIGSSCIGASVVGGICNNSGGSLVKRGPAYTELALYAQLSEQGELELVIIWGLRWAILRRDSVQFGSGPLRSPKPWPSMVRWPRILNTLSGA
ncbi:MAG: hypothetical protein CM15mP74_27120 [Halieaceae bacterium]|nr:MAG: hypothetical protein CM15mP74_27120 [Halieaceae bacterium]